jgi:hypothetical protein
MNDSTNVYFTLQVGRSTYGGNTTFAMYFDNDADGVIEAGDDAFLADIGRYSPVRFIDWHWGPCIPGGEGAACPVLDLDRGGTSDGVSAAGIGPDGAVLEVSHPLDSADNAHDFSLRPGSVVGFAVLVTLWNATTTCTSRANCYANTLVPVGLSSHAEASGYGDLVIAPDLVPPETSITDGPAEGATVRESSSPFRFTGKDNLTRVTAYDRVGNASSTATSRFKV